MEMSKAKAEKKALPKRFYAAVSVQQNAATYAILLDGKLLRTQARHALAIPSVQLANALAAEWEAQVDCIDPSTMPLTRLINLAIDRAPHDRAAWIADMVGFAETDLLCYRAPHDARSELRQWQDAQFDPILHWAAAQHIRLVTTDGLMPIPQPTASVRAVEAMLSTSSDGELTALAMLTPLLGSVVMALALWKGALHVEAAIAAARLDEDAQAAHWGKDAETEAALAAKQRDIHAALLFLQAWASH